MQSLLQIINKVEGGYYVDDNTARREHQPLRVEMNAMQYLPGKIK